MYNVTALQETSPFPSEVSSNIEKALKAFSSISEVPVTFFESSGEIKWECNSEYKICNFFDVYKTPNSVCTSTLMSSAKVASRLGEPYIFVCKAGFVKIAVSLIVNSRVLGCFMAGPIVMGRISESIISNIYKINSQNMVPEILPKLTIFLRNMKIFSPKDVADLSVLFNSSIMSSIIQNEDYTKINEQYKEQARIGEDLQNLKKQNKSMLYPYKIEKELIKKVKNGDSKGASEVMQDLLSEILLIEAGNLDLVKTKMLEIYAILSRAALESDSSLQKIFGTNLDYLNLLNDVESVHELRHWATDLIRHFTKNVFDSMYSGSSYVISQVISLIRSNYMNKISLEKIAKTLFINPSYLSMHFKNEMGVTFTDYLNDVRIKVSKDLLTTSNLSLLEVSLHSGFEDQSYFTKVFKKCEGCTPREYRKMMQRKNE